MEPRQQDYSMRPNKRSKQDALGEASDQNVHLFVANCDMNLWFRILVEAKKGAYKAISFTMENLINFRKFDELRGEKCINSFVDAKFRQDDRNVICYNDLDCNMNGEFSIYKYFNSYNQMRKVKRFDWDDVENFTIYTNVDLNVADLEMNGISVQKTELNDDLSFAVNVTATKYNLVIDESCNLYHKLLDTSELHTLAKIFAKQICIDSKLSTENYLMKTYHSALFTEGIIDRDMRLLSHNFCRNKLPNVREFRTIFVREGMQILGQEENSFWSSMGQRKLTWSRQFDAMHASDNAKFPMSRDLFNEFLHKFSIIISLPDKGERNRVLRKELAEKNVVDTSLVCFDLTKKLLELLRKENIANTWMECLESKMSELMVAHITRTIADTVAGVKFSLEYLEHIKQQEIKFEVSDKADNTIYFLMGSNCERLSTAYVIQELHENSIDNYIVVTLDVLLKIHHIYKKAYSDKKCKFLILECSSGTFQQFCNEYEKVVESLQSIFSKLILISDNENLFTNLFEQKTVVPELIYFTDLSNESQNEFLSRKIYFQGVHMPLEKLVKDDRYLVTGKLLTHLITNKQIYINDNRELMVETTNYIKRTLSRSIHYTEFELIELITELPNLVVAVAGQFVDVQQLNNKLQCKLNASSRFVAHANQSIDDLRRTHIGSDIFLVEKLLCLSKYKIKEIISDNPEKYIHFVHQNFDHDDFLNYALNKKKIIKLVDEPGMGKSTFLKSLTSAIKLKDSELWISLVNLTNCTRILKEASNESSPNYYTLFLKLATHNCKERYELKIFNRKHNNGQVVFMIDGFDEIDPDLRNVLIDLMRCFLINIFDTVVLVTRPYTIFYETVNDDHFYLKPLDVEQQKSYLKTKWYRDIDTNPSFTDDSFQLFIDTLFRKLLSHKQNVDITSCPMILCLVSKIFKKDFRRFYHSLDIADMQTSTKTYNVASLYEAFVSLILDEYKVNNLKCMYDQYFVLMKKALQNHALKYICHSHNDDYTQMLHASAKRLITDMDLIDLGFLRSADEYDNDNEKYYFDEKTNLRFVHFTFVEYFIAKAFAEQVQQVQQHQEFDEKLLQISPNVKTFYNLILLNFGLTNDSPSKKLTQ